MVSAPSQRLGRQKLGVRFLGFAMPVMNAIEGPGLGSIEFAGHPERLRQSRLSNGAVVKDLADLDEKGGIGEHQQPESAGFSVEDETIRAAFRSIRRREQ